MNKLFQIIDKFKTPRLRSSSHGTRSRSGQVAVILIVTIAIGLVLFAASINLTMVSQSKTLTMKAASASASQMASALASYGQKQFVETLGGRKEYCKKSSGGLISLIVLIILVIITIVCWGGCAGATGAAAGGITGGGLVASAAAVAAVMQGISIVISATTDPGISEAWNKMIDANLSQTGQFVERGIMTGLQSAVTDSGKIPDLYDEDSDGLFGYQGGDINNPANDEIARFAHNMTRRYIGLQGADTAPTNAFIIALHDLISDSSDGFAFLDPVYYPDSSTKAPGHSATHLCYQNFYKPPPDALGTPNPLYSQRPAECDPCCQQLDPTDPLNEACSAAAGLDQIGDRATCSARTFFRAAGNLYQYVYDPTYEDSTNAFLSFREQMGRDDENPNYHTVQVRPNWHEDPVNEPQQLIVAPSPTGFSLTDVVGYYTAPGFPANTDQWVSPRPLPVGVVANRPKIYPFLYKMKDWGAKLSAVTYSNYECNLCDANKPANPGRDCPADLSPEIGRLTLSSDPTTVPWNFGQGWCVNNTNKGGVDDPPVVPDNVTDIPGLIVPDNQCALPWNTTVAGVSDITQYVQGWKPGADRYCSNAVDTDYSRYCPKNDPANPETVCGQPGVGAATMWPDDMLDEITYGEIPQIFAIEQALWKAKTSGNLKQLASQIDEWYGKPAPGEIRANDGIADWIEPPCPDPGNCPGSFTKLERPGRLWVWRELFVEYRNLLSSWLRPSDGGKPNYVSPTCFGAGAVWCVQGNPCPGANAAETLTFDFNINGDIGDLEDVIECLKWNANDVFTYPDTTTATGNAQKFAKCFNTCNQGNCSNLPRSLVPDFYTHLPLEFYPGDEALFNACLTSDLATCNAKCSIVPTGAPYNIAPPFAPPDGPQITAIDDWCSNPLTNVAHLDFACNGGGTLYCNANTEGQVPNEDACRCSWANDCTLSTTCGTLCPPGSFCAKITAAIIPSKGSCGNAQAPAFMIALQQSAAEAQVQVDKFRQRIKFLQGRSDEAEAVRLTLTTAIDKLTAFLDNGTPNDFTDSPAERFIQARMAPLQDTTKDLPSFAIYVWQDKDPILMNPAGAPRWGTGQGYWHAVKVDVRMPRRCAGDCIAEDWPKVHSSTSGGFLSKKVCYKLINLTGMTKARVIRYDQDKDLTGLVFPGGAAIWESRLSNPTLSSAPDPTGLRVTCADFIDPDLALWLGGATDKNHIGAAFMLNKIPNFTTPGNYENCWTQVHQRMLAHGVMSEACAQYYFVDDGSGFHVKFVPCDNW